MATLVSLMLVNNETGAIQPVAAAAELAHAHGAIVHCDAAQAVGRMPVDWHGLGVDLMTLSAHKFGGPQGVGALLVRPGLSLSPLIVGGGQEFHLRGGTENVAAICGMAAAFQAALGDDAGAVADARDGFEARLRAVSPAIRIFAEEVRRLPNTSCFAHDGIMAETAVMALDLLGVAVSSGSACSSGKVGRSHVLEAMGVPADLARRGALRVSLGWNTTEGDLTQLIEAWRELVSRPAARSAASRKTTRRHQWLILTPSNASERSTSTNTNTASTTAIEMREGAERPVRGDDPLHLGQEGRAAMDAGLAARGLSALAADDGADLGPCPLSEDRLPGPLLLLRAQRHVGSEEPGRCRSRAAANL